MEKSEREGDSMMMWEVSSLGDLKSAATEIGSNQKEAFILSGDDAFVIHSMNNLPAEASCLWRPTSSVARPLLLLESSPISVWRLRSNPGILGMVLEWQDIVFVCQPPQQDWDAGQLYTSLKKMRQPCSAMDYPPTIYMIGEDEVS
ncbi:expressed unknown protein [Seminavis robusta]|uniref:Uncharacterized protein n=1 Tax=Seminavis robusta TaxID=568900 RepID=A0A9N8HAR8_9STRA|nr:expressed unknown protein [Seminavis robusta]|eukprot:Sro157_g071410.1 n/a (146) ;mRNA; r:102002-102439